MPNQRNDRANLFQEGFGSGSGGPWTSRAVSLDDSGSGRDTSADDIELESTAAEAPPPAASPDPVSSRAASTSTSKSTNLRAALPSGSSSGLYPATTMATRFG